MNTSTQSLRYQLPKKAIKSDCPQCGTKHRRTLSRYVDTRTGEPLPKIYGKCDRQSNCGYHWGPYYKGPSGLSYADEVYHQWREEQQTLGPSPIFRSGASKSRQHMQSMTLTAPSVLYRLPNELLIQSLGHYERNTFALFLMEQFGYGVTNELLIRFQIGTSNHWPGACVFWLKDEHGHLRGGQVVLFESTGHTAKRQLEDGSTKRCTSWVHYALATRYDRKQQNRPDWLTTYIDKADKFPIPYGLHQLTVESPDKAVAIVESPKTAIICTAYFPEFIWMAIGGLTYLGLERLDSVRSRKLVLFPDISTGGKAFELWSTRAKQLRQEGFSITVSDYLEQRATDEEKADGLDLADYLLNQWKGYPPDWDTVEDTTPLTLTSTSLPRC